MKKHLSLLMLVAALIVPWASRAQDCTQTVPYTQDFESFTGTTYSASTGLEMPSCWNGFSSSTSTSNIYMPRVVSGTGSYVYYHGQKGFAMTGGTATSYGMNKYVLLPPMNVPLNQLQLTFWMCTESNSASYGTLHVGYVTSDDTSTFVSIANYPSSAATHHSGNGPQASGVGLDVELILSQIPATATRLAFKWEHSNSSFHTCCIDDIVVGYPPSCPRVDSLFVTPSSDEVLVSWVEMGSATEWEVAVSNTTGVVSTNVVSTNPATITNLIPNTNYTVSVRAVCSIADTSIVRSTDFRTLCSAVEADSLPWTYGFEDASGTGASASFNPCMRKLTNYTTAYPYPSSTNKHGGTYSLYFYSTSAYYSCVSLPMMEEDIENLYLTFWAYKTSANYGHVYVGVMSNPGDISTFDTIATLQVSAVSAWEFFEVPLSSYTGNGGVIALLSPNMSAASYVYIDDITVTYPPACPMPSGLIASNATANSVDLSWTSNASEFIVEYGRQGFTQGTGDSMIVNANAVTLTGLSMGVSYGVYVTAVCGDDTSNSLYGTVTSGCGTITANDLPYIEDFEAYGSGSAYPINACWHKGVVAITGSGTTTNYPYPTSTAINGSRSLYFYALHSTSNCYYNWMVLPPIDESLSMSDLMVTFNMKRYTNASYKSTLVVGVTTDYTSTAGFVPVDTIDLTSLATGTVQSVEVSFANYTDTGRYVLFYAPAPAMTGSTTTYNVFYVDDIALRVIPNCFWPTEVVLDSVTSESANISWVPDSRTTNPSGWNIEYGPAGFTLGNGLTETTTDTVLELTNLLPNTVYDVYVSADCGGDVSDPAIFTFRTTCAPIINDSLPYVENFESYGSGTTAFPTCWYKLGSTADRPYIHATTTYGHNNSHGLYFYAAAGGYCYGIMPPVDSMLDLSALQLTFWARQYSASYNCDFVVGVMTDPTDATTFTAIEQVHPTGTEYEMFEVPLASYTGSGLYIAFQAVQHPGTSTAIYLMLDDVTLGPLPDCPRPTDLNVDSLSYDAALLTWFGSNENAFSYNVYYSTQAGFNPDTCQFTTVYDTFALITGLQSYTKYYWTVVANCGSDTSNVPMLQSFTTLVNCGNGYVNIQDTIGAGTSSGYTYFAYNYTSYPYGKSASIFTVDELGAMGLLAGANINSISVHAGATACTINGFKVYMVEADFDEFSAVSDTNLINALNPTLVFNGNLTTTSNQWVEIPLTTPFAYSGSNNLIVIFERNVAPSASGNFYYGGTSSAYRTLYVYKSSATATASGSRAAYRVNVAFNLCAEVPSCIRPTNVALDDLNDNSATLSWVSNAGNFEYTIGPSGFDPDSSTAVITPLTADSVVIIGLTSNTEYDFYVRTVCGNDVSEWSIVTSFRTACSPMQLPYFEDFESYGSGSANPISACWSKGTSSTTAYPYPYATNAISGQRSLYFYGYYPSSTSSTPIYSYAALPMMAAPVDTLAVAFSMRRYATTTTYYTSRLVVGVMVNPEDISTFTPVDTFDLRNEDALSVHRFEVLFNNYTGNGQYIAFYDEVPPLYGNTYSYSYVYLDDIEVDYIPTCSRPTNVTINNIGQTTATVHWTSSATNFEVEYGEHGFVQGTGTTLTASGDSINIAGLTAGVNYDVYVRALCSATDMSPWSFAASFYTECGIFALPYTEDFESYNSGASIGISPCWVKGTNSTTAYPYPYSTNAVTGQRSLYFYSYLPSSTSTTAIYSYAALPEFNAPVNTLELSFNMRRYSSTGNTYTSLIVVGVMTDPTNINTFSAIDTIDLQTATASSIHEVNVTFDSYTDTGKYITLYAPVPPLYGGTYTYNYTYIDDIFVAPISPCPRAYNLTAYNGTTTSVTLEWTDTIGSSQWVVEYGELGDTATSTVTVNTNPYVLTGLTPNTNYRYRVAPICSNSQQADWSRTWHKFSTALNPATLPYSYDFEAAGEWANWQTNSNNTINWYRGTAATGNNTNAVYLSTDNGATHSWNMNILTNAVVYRDIDFGPDTHSYQIDFDAYIGGTIGHNYDGISVVVADPAVFVEGSNTGITSPWGNVNTVGLGTVRHDTVWGHHTIYVDGIAGVKRVAIYHFNQATGSGNPYEDNPSAIDNISIVQQACERPANLVATNATINSVQLSWFGEPTAQYQVAYRPQTATSAANQYAMVNGTSTTIYGLNAATNYYWWVRKICTLTATDTLVSGFSVNGSFTTLCAVVSVADTLFEDFENYAGEVYNAEGVLPNCWEGYMSGTTGYVPHVTNGATYSYCVSGTNAITMTAGTPSTYGSDTYMRLVDIAEPTNTLTMTFWMCTESSTNGFLEIGYLTGSNYATDFVAVKRINASTATVHTGNGLQPAGYGIFDTVVFDSVPMGNFPICFHWNYTTSFYSCCIDDVKVWSSNACSKPLVTLTDPSYESVTLTAAGTGSLFELEYGSDPVNYGNTMTSTDGVFAITGLTPATQYFYRVRQQCDSNIYSLYSEGFFITDSLPCTAVSDLTLVGTTFNSVSVSWTANGEETAWEVHVFSTVNDTTVTVTTTAATVDGLVSERLYNVSVRPLCGSNHNIEGPWSDTIQFTPDPCQPVENVTVSNIGTTTATISWTAPENASNFRVIYGLPNFDQGGELASYDTETNPFELTNLEPNSDYTVRVANVCAENLVSQWTSADFSTEGVGINGVEFDGSLSLYPNPASTTVTLSVSEQMVGSTVSIVDINGRVVMSEVLNNQTLTVDLSNMSQGAYFVRITGEQNTVVRKLIVK